MVKLACPKCGKQSPVYLKFHKSCSDCEELMTPQPDNHTLNACLARAIGVDIEERVDPDYRTYFVYWRDCGGCHSLQEWNPLGDANQMEEVEAWLRENGLNFRMEYDASLTNYLWVIDLREDSTFYGEDPDKKRAFALAIWQMEQAQQT